MLLGRYKINLQFLLIVLMAKANSFKDEPWTSLGKYDYSIIDDDFIHNKLLVFKATRKSASSTISLKETFTQGESKITGADQLKLWFPFRETRTLYAVVKNDGFKVHYDHGLQSHGAYLLNFYGALNSKRSIEEKNLVYKIGFEALKNQLAINFRLRVSAGENGISLYNRFKYTEDKWSFATVNSYNVFRKFWNYSSTQVGVKLNDDTQAFLRFNGGKKYDAVKPLNFLNEVTFDSIYKYNASNRFGFQAVANAADLKLTNAALVWEHKCAELKNTGIKVKADVNRNLSVAVKNQLPNYGNYIFGVNVANFGGANRFTYGIQVDLEL